MPSAWDQTASGASPAVSAWDATPMGQQPAPPQKPTLRADEKIQNYSGADAVGGWLSGLANIGSTLLHPLGLDRREDAELGAATLTGGNRDSTAFKTNKLGAEVLATMPAGGALAQGLRMIPGAAKALPTLIPAIESGGFSAPGAKGAYEMAARGAGGAVSGGLTAGLVDPNQAREGAFFGAATPLGIKAAGAAGQYINDKGKQYAAALMQSAIKPTIAQLKSGDAQVATKVLLENGLNPTKGGAEKLRTLIDKTDDEITSAIAGSTASIDKQAVLGALGDTRKTFTTQAAPQGDLAAIQSVEDAFKAHPLYPNQTIPIQDAQTLKRGTYSILSKKYGQMGSADTEAQKAIARGLKDEIAAAVPGISETNAKQSDLIRALEVANRRALMEGNKNPFGLAALASHPGSFALFMADKSALIKALTARGLNAASPLGLKLGQAGGPGLLPFTRAAALEANP